MVGSFTEPPLLSRETVLTEIPASFARSFEDSTPDFSMAALNLVLLIRYITIATPFDLWYCVSITSVVDDTLHLCLSQYHICDFYSMHRNEDYILAFYNTFELLCKKKGVTPTRAARESGLAQSVASMWKKRGSTPSGENLQKLANYFGCTVEYLLGDVPEPSMKEEKKPSKEAEQEITFDDFTYAMINETKELTDGDKELLLSLVRQLNSARKNKDGTG